MKKKLAAVFLLLSVFAGAAGCGNTSQADDLVTNEGYEEALAQGTADSGAVSERTETKAGTKVIAKENLKIGVLYIGSKEDSSGYTYAHELGISTMAGNLGLKEDQILRKEELDDSKPEEIAQALQECVDAGCNVIFGTSFGFMEEMEKFAEQYPEIYFAHGSGYLSNGKNFTNYFGRIYQARYLSGIAAGLKTQSGKIGYVAAQDQNNAEVTGGIDAFALGVESVNPEAEVYVKVTNSWFDPEAEAAAAQALLAEGCDVLAQHCDTTEPQKAAQEKGVWGIGYNSDMSKESPKATLTSVLWNWSAYYTSYIQSILDGSYDGTDYYGGMQEGLLQLSDLADFNQEEAAAKIQEAEQKILRGEFQVFEGVMETNDGKKVGTPGQALADEVITGEINWYYKNVLVLE